MDLNLASVLLACVQSNDIAAIDEIIQYNSLTYRNFNAIGSPYNSLLELSDM